MATQVKVTHEIAATARVELHDLGQKLRGIGYLIEHQKWDDCPPLDFEEVYEGVGRLVRELGEQITSTWRILDEWEVTRSRKRHSTKDPE